MFREQIISFSENLENLRDFVNMISAFLSEKNEEELKENAVNLAPFMIAMHKLDPDKFKLDKKKISKIENEFGFKIEIGLIDNKDQVCTEKGVRIKIEGDGETRFINAIKMFKADINRREALYRNALISLISSVEWFLAQLIHKHYKENPGIVGTKEKQFSLEELANFESIEDARNFLIDKAVESVLRGSIEDWMEFLKSKLKLSMGYIEEHKKLLVEATRRRNLLVHNGGVVNRIYLANYPKNLSSPPELGTKINVSPEYLSEKISLFERCFLLIAAELWKKVGADNATRGKLLINLAYKHLIAERYDIAGSLSYFAANDKSLQEVDQLYARVNYWISKKYGKGFEDVEPEIKKSDFSAKSRLFILAKNTLLSNFCEAKCDIEYLIKHDENFTFREVQTWPLFRELREKQIYIDLCEKYDEKSQSGELEAEPGDDTTENVKKANEETME